ncbi:MAG: pseudouridine synthase [Puniceicoccales bacterium]
MASSQHQRFIGFPPPLLGERPLRLPVLGAEPGRWLALDKPAGILTDRHRWHPDLPGLLAAFNEQVEMGKPELEPYEITVARHVYILEPETTGVLLLALSEKAIEELRDAYGSALMNFTFGFLARWDGGDKKRTCSLTISVHTTEPRALVSHQSGKKCETVFQMDKRLGNYAWWKAEAKYMRPHQIRLHAAEVGLPVVGDRLYGGPPPICLSALKRDYRSRGVEKPLYDGLCLHLESLVLPDGARLESPLPKGLGVLQRRLSQHARD